MRKLQLVFTALLLSVVLTAPLSATVMTPLSESQLIEVSNAIVVGKCVAVESGRQGRKIVTRVTIEVQEALKGKTPDRATVWIPGGIDNSGPVAIGSLVPGAPVFVPDEEVLLFLQRPNGVESGSDFGVVGLAQGKFTLVTDSAGDTWAVRSLGGAISPSGQSLQGHAKLSLEKFKARILALVEPAREEPSEESQP